MSTYGNHAPVLDAPPLAEPAAPARYRVLLVEDDPEYGRMVERVMRRARPALWVHREERLDGGLHRLECDHYDAVVMDLKLPTRPVAPRSENACALASHLPVVVLTSTDDDALALDAIRGGAEDYLVKQRTHALTLPGAVLRAIERHHRNGARSISPVAPSPSVVDEVALPSTSSRARSPGPNGRRAPVAVMVAGFADLDWLPRGLRARRRSSGCSRTRPSGWRCACAAATSSPGSARRGSRSCSRATPTGASSRRSPRTSAP